MGFMVFEELVSAGCIHVRGEWHQGGMVVGVDAECGSEEEDSWGISAAVLRSPSHYPLSLSRVVVPSDAVVEISTEFLERTVDDDYDPFCLVYTDDKFSDRTFTTTPDQSHRSCPHVRVSSSTSIQLSYSSEPSIFLPDHMTLYSAKEYSGTWDVVTLEFDEGFELLTTIPLGLLGHSFIRSVDLTHFCNVTTIRAHFLVNCARLTKIDLSPFTKVTQVGSGFLEACTALTEVDLTPLAGLTTIPPQFLFRCSSLRVVDMGGLVHVSSVGSNLLRSAVGLTSVTLPPNVVPERMGSNCLDGCPNVVSSDPRIVSRRETTSLF